MKIEHIVLISILALIFILDFFRKLTATNTKMTIHDEAAIKKSKGLFKSISRRKKNITLFVFLIHLIKVIIHYLIFPRSYVTRPLTPAEGFLPRNQIVDTGKWVELSIEYHFKSIYSERLDLFIYSTILLSFVAWYFNDNIKAK